MILPAKKIEVSIDKSEISLENRFEGETSLKLDPG